MTTGKPKEYPVLCSLNSAEGTFLLGILLKEQLLQDPVHLRVFQGQNFLRSYSERGEWRILFTDELYDLCTSLHIGRLDGIGQTFMLPNKCYSLLL
jgi:hypothetical protein